MNKIFIGIILVIMLLDITAAIYYYHSKSYNIDEEGILIEKSSHHHVYVNDKIQWENRYFIKVKLAEKEIVFEVPPEYFDQEIGNKIKMSITRNYFSDEIKRCKLKQYKNIVWDYDVHDGIIWN